VADSLPWPENVWADVRVEDTAQAWRADRLREVPAAIQFISAEPPLGLLAKFDLGGIDWLIPASANYDSYAGWQDRTKLTTPHRHHVLQQPLKPSRKMNVLLPSHDMIVETLAPHPTTGCFNPIEERHDLRYLEPTTSCSKTHDWAASRE